MRSRAATANTACAVSPGEHAHDVLVGRVAVHACCFQCRHQAIGIQLRPHLVDAAARTLQLRDRAFGCDPALVDDDHAVARVLDVRQEMR